MFWMAKNIKILNNYNQNKGFLLLPAVNVCHLTFFFSVKFIVLPVKVFKNSVSS